MTDLSALILAAGLGVRMGPRGELTPKGLLKIEGVPLVRRSVELLRKHGLKHIRIVTGHLNEQYEAEFADDADVELIHNPDYDHTGSLKSLLTGLNGVDGNLVVLESDVIYEARALSPVQSGATRIVLSGETNATDEVYVWVRDGAADVPAFDFMSKKIGARPETHFGELVGITCFSAENTRALKAAGQGVAAQNPKADYEDAVIALSEGTDIEAVLLQDLAWTEIDDETMFARALSVVWPAIEAREGSSG